MWCCCGSLLNCSGVKAGEGSTPLLSAMNDFFGISNKVIDDLENGRKIQTRCLDNYLRVLLMVRPCRNCNGSGVDPKAHFRYTSGGHDDRSCPTCYGEGIIEIKSEPQDNDTCQVCARQKPDCLCGLATDDKQNGS